MDAGVAGVDSITVDLKMIDFKLPPPKELSEPERFRLIGSSITRIWDGAEEMKANEVGPVDVTQASGQSATDMWMLLLVRMITRVAEPPPSFSQGVDDKEEAENRGELVHDFYARQDQLRQTLCDYIMSDFPSR